MTWMVTIPPQEPMVRHSAAEIRDCKHECGPLDFYQVLIPWPWGLNFIHQRWHTANNSELQYLWWRGIGPALY